MPSPTAFRLRGNLPAIALVLLAAAACGSPAAAKPPASPAASPASTTAQSARERQAVLAFQGIYRVKSVVTATTGSYAESIGAVHFYTWQAVPECDGQSCTVTITSSSGSRTTFTYANGTFRGVGHGSATCVDPSTGDPIGASATTLRDTLVPATTSSPTMSLSGSVRLTVLPGCGGGGTGTFRYTLTRTGNASAGTADSTA